MPPLQLRDELARHRELTRRVAQLQGQVAACSTVHCTIMPLYTTRKDAPQPF
jgi:hypothetical protein